MALCESQIYEGHDYWSEYELCIERLEQTGEGEVTLEIQWRLSDHGEYGWYPCFEMDIEVDGAVAKTIDMGCGLEPVNNAPYTVVFENLSPGDHEFCVKMPTEYDL